MDVDIITKYTDYLKAYRLAPSTQKTYLCEFKAFRDFYPNEDLRYISRHKIITYLARLYDLEYSDSKVNQAINSIKFYKEKILGKKRDTYFLKRPRRKKFIPPILSQQKMFEIIDSVKNLKHRTLLYLVYINGLRRGEIINMKLVDVRSKADKPHLIIRNAKHNSSRLLFMEEEIVAQIRFYFIKYKPKKYLFEGYTPGEPISASTIARILDKALKANGITERFRVHDLRHNFSTHCLLNGTSIYDLAYFLGHKSVETTEKYYAHLVPSDIRINRPQRPQAAIYSGRIISINRKIRA